jgi:hypothetical protein
VGLSKGRIRELSNIGDEFFRDSEAWGKSLREPVGSSMARTCSLGSSSARYGRAFHSEDCALPFPLWRRATEGGSTDRFARSPRYETNAVNVHWFGMRQYEQARNNAGRETIATSHARTHTALP